REPGGRPQCRRGPVRGLVRRGPVRGLVQAVTRSFLSDYEGILPAEVMDALSSLQSLPGIPVLKGLTQTLQLDGERLVTENAGKLSLDNVGSWRVSATGIWKDSGDGRTAEVEFDSLAVQPMEIFGMDSAQLPEFRLPIPDALQQEAKWETTYIDDNLRINRGKANKVFIFRRSGSMPEAIKSSAAQLQSGSSTTPLTWTPEAKADLDRAPFFVKDAAKKKAEDYARSKGLAEIDMDVVKASK
ncbi:hypothetical protein CYMTET_16429, partial [Cymbomonas tetramitiformis]